MAKDYIYEDEYFEWLMSFIASNKYSPIRYTQLLKQLSLTDFVYFYPMDENRAMDGINLRYRCEKELNGKLYCYGYPCSILEMMIALALRIEEEIMFDEDMGDRTPDWFWEMIYSLGLITCTDDDYDEIYISEVIHDFLHRNYDFNGRGGLFTVGENENIRDKEIWYQMQKYLNYIMERRFI